MGVKRQRRTRSAKRGTRKPEEDLEVEENPEAGEDKAEEPKAEPEPEE